MRPSSRLASPAPRRPRCRAGIIHGLWAAAALVPHTAAGQLPDWVGEVEAEVRTGVTIGSHSRSAAALDIVPKLSFDVLVKRRLVPHLSVFGGYFRTAFGCEEGFCTGTDLTVVGNHGALGVQWDPTVSWLQGEPWIHAGLLFGSTRAGTEGDQPRPGVGMLFGTGATVGFVGRLVFMPGLSYRWLTANTVSSTAHAIALSLHLGFGMKLSG